MKNGKLESQNSQHEKKHILNKIQLLILSLLVVITVTVGGTVAYLTTKSDSVVNTFEPSQVSCTVTEDFRDGKTKKDINVTNDSDINAYIRVKLVSYRVNSKGEHIGGATDIPELKLGSNWVHHTDGYYYYTLPVEPHKQPAANLNQNGITLREYTDVDGGKQVIEVMAEAIQSEPAAAVGEAWGVTITPGNVAAYNNN